jgi:DNA recombination protein RmuC
VLGEVKQHLESLAQQSQSLAAETQQFRMVLKSAPARGRWGEETLKRVTEAAGMSAHCDFDVQTGVEGQRPDLVVKLPGDRVIIVDAKVPELDFLTALDEADPLKREAALANHAAKLKSTIQDLAKRDYPKLFPHALDYVVLFLPAESLFSAALEGDRDLLVWAADKRILLATPASLIALLRSVSVSWQHYDQTQNAREIAEKARDFYDRVVTFSGHFAAIGEGLGKAATAYDKAVRSYESRVRPGGERLKALGGADIHNPLPEVDAIDPNLRLLDPPPENS